MCPDFDEAFKHDILAKYDANANDIRNLKFPNVDISSVEFYDTITHNLTELLGEMQISMHKPIKGTKYTRVKRKLLLKLKNSMKIIFLSKIIIRLVNVTPMKCLISYENLR